jgi:hypothetical protein
LRRKAGDLDFTILSRGQIRARKSVQLKVDRRHGKISPEDFADVTVDLGELF